MQNMTKTIINYKDTNMNGGIKGLSKMCPLLWKQVPELVSGEVVFTIYHRYHSLSWLPNKERYSCVMNSDKLLYLWYNIVPVEVTCHSKIHGVRLSKSLTTADGWFRNVACLSLSWLYVVSFRLSSFFTIEWPVYCERFKRENVYQG